MTNFFTPNEFQDLKKQKTPHKVASVSGLKPSVLTMKVILGYNAALEVLKSKNYGNIGILIN